MLRCLTDGVNLSFSAVDNRLTMAKNFCYFMALSPTCIDDQDAKEKFRTTMEQTYVAASELNIEETSIFWYLFPSC